MRLSSSSLLPSLILLACSYLTPATVKAADFYVSPRSGNDQNTGAKESPFRSIRRAMKELDGIGGTLHLTPHEGFYREPIAIPNGGTAEQRLIIEGNGATINLGTDVTAGPWTKTGEGEYRLEREAPKHGRQYVTSPLFINGLPVWAAHPTGKGIAPWHGGQLKQDEQNRFTVKFPDGLTPDNSVIVMTAKDFQAGIQSNGGSFITIRNLNICFVGNDGFNFHNHSRDVVLENITALFNGDQGISSHGSCEVNVKGGEIAFNGSQSGGVVDINDTKTTYTDLIVHHNRHHGFTLIGAQHKLSGITSYGHQLSNLPKPGDAITLENCQDLGSKPQDQMVKAISKDYSIDPSAKADRDDRIARFLELRPVN